MSRSLQHQANTSTAWNVVNHFGNPNNDLAPFGGTSYVLLATGPATGTSHSKSIGGNGMSDPFANDGFTTYDAMEIKLKMTAPMNVTGFTIDYVFLSVEYEEWIGSSYNDKFYIILKAPTTTNNQKKPPVRSNMKPSSRTPRLEMPIATTNFNPKIRPRRLKGV